MGRLLGSAAMAAVLAGSAGLAANTGGQAGLAAHGTSVSTVTVRYTAVYSAPAGALVTLRTSATDDAGGAITDTLSNAYRTAS